jgi:type I restriction enzyme S subunit
MDSTSLQPQGEYPDNWPRLSFDEFTTLKRGKDLTRDQFREGIIPVAGSNGHIGFHDTANVKAPGVTVGRSGSVGRVTFYSEDFWAHNTALFVTNFHGNDPRFASYFLDSLKLQRFGSGVSVPTLDRNVFRALAVVVPPLGEQRKIAGVLGLVQRALEQQERLIALTTELKKALLHQLFTQGLRGEPPKQTDIGLVPQSWEVVTLEDAAVALDYGTSVKCEHGKAGVPVLRIPNVMAGSVDLRDLKHGQPKRSELEQLRLRDGDLLFVRTNGVLENAGRCALYRGELEGCYFASYLIRVRVNSTKVLPAFVNEYARTGRGRSFLSGRAIRTADGKFNINSGTLKRVLLPLPGLDEQKEIVCQLDLVERKLKLHESKRSALSDLLRTLLHQLMTAQLRVHDLNLPELKAAKRQ